MLPILEGTIARRLVLNFRADPKDLAPLVPAPLTIEVINGYAVFGVCLIKLEKVRMKGMPRVFGVSAESMAHRIAVKEGVFIWRRDTGQRLMSTFGGRLFPGIFQPAHFHVEETKDEISMQIQTKNGEADTRLRARYGVPWKATPVFPTLEQASRFLEVGNCGFSCARAPAKLEGMRLETQRWKVESLHVEDFQSRYLDGLSVKVGQRFEFDHALSMHNIPHQWHELPKEVLR
jgi:hypothetical protein